jgi:outer membrane protein OmpA-like peptidoglycan-associated protein
MKGNEPNLTLSKSICLTKLKEGDEFELRDIYYDLDKATLRPLSIVQLERAYDFLVRNRNIKLELSSHTDSRASNEYNQNLSQRRAQACVDYLVKVKGIPSGRIVAKGYGETKLTNKCADGVPCTEEEHQLNRRTEIRILKTN